MNTYPNLIQDVYAPATLVEERPARTYVLPITSVIAPVPAFLDKCGEFALGNSEIITLSNILPTTAKLAILSAGVRYLFWDFMDGYDVYDGEDLATNTVIEVWSDADFTLDVTMLKSNEFLGDSVELAYTPV